MRVGRGGRKGCCLLYCLANVEGGGWRPGPAPAWYAQALADRATSSHGCSPYPAGRQGAKPWRAGVEKERPTQAARDTPPPPTAVLPKEGETGGEGTEDGTQQEGKAIPYWLGHTRQTLFYIRAADTKASYTLPQGGRASATGGRVVRAMWIYAKRQTLPAAAPRAGNVW